MEGNGTQKKTLSFNLFVKFRGNGTQKDEIFGTAGFSQTILK